MNTKQKIAIAASVGASALAACAGLFSRVTLFPEEKTNDLRALWSRDRGEEKNGWTIDYSFYSPVAHGADESKKYPLVVILAGALEGQYEGKELEANEMPKWAAKKYQSRFTNGAAFLMIPRAPEDKGRYWDYSGVVPALKAAIDGFCSKNPCIDTDRIYLVGWCLGGTGVINLASAYPDDFAAVMPMSFSRPITKTEALRLKNTPVWFMGGFADTYAFFAPYVLPSFFMLKSVSVCKQNVRLTTYLKNPSVELVPGVPFVFNHNTWDNVAEDLHFEGKGYQGALTLNGNLHKIEDPYAIDWLCSFKKSDKAESTANQEAKSKAIKSLEKKHAYFHEEVRNNIRLKTFDVMTVIYKKMKWI